MFFEFVLMLLAALGVFSIIEWTLARICRPKQKLRCINVLLLRGHCGQLESVLRYCYGAMRWSRWLAGGLLLLADCGADEETLRIARSYCVGRNGVELCDEACLHRLFADDTVCKYLRIVLY